MAFKLKGCVRRSALKKARPYIKLHNYTSYIGLETRNRGMGTDFLERRNVGIA